MLSLPGTAWECHTLARRTPRPLGEESSGRSFLLGPPPHLPSPPAATPEPALSEALQGGDRVTRLSASGRAIASGGGPLTCEGAGRAHHGGSETPSASPSGGDVTSSGR